MELYREIFPFIDWLMALYFKATVHRHLGGESVGLMADVKNEVVTIQSSQQMLKMLYLDMQTFLSLAEEDLVHSLKLFCRNNHTFSTK
jgi:hypothetical protein